MGGFILKRDGWRDVPFDRSACGAFVLEVDAGGHRHFYSAQQLDIQEYPGGPSVSCVSAILNAPSFDMTIDPYERQFNVGQMQFTLMAKFFPTAQLVRAGQEMSKLEAKVYWLVTGKGFTLDEAFLVVKGLVAGFYYSEQSDQVSFSVVDNQLSGDRRFPPHAVTTASFSAAGIPPDSFGKPYPVIIGSVVKLPVIDISAGKTRYLVCEDQSAAMGGASVATVYDSDSTCAINTQGSANDAQGVDYYYVDITGAAATSMDVSADVDNGMVGNLIESIFYLLTSFSSKRDMFDYTSLNRLNKEFGAITLSLVFNSVVEGGAIQAVKERLIKELPLTIVQMGEKFYFQSLLWDTDVCKVLSTDTNIVQVVSEPAEVGRGQIANDFVVRSGVTGLRGDSLIAVTANKDNDAICLSSYRRYGELGRREIDLPDCSDQYSAAWLMNWVVETFARMRLRVSYFCTLDAVDLKLWDTVQVYDQFQGWTHGPLFKVVGIHYGESNGITVDLLSLEDTFDVHRVNRKVYECLELLGAKYA